MLEGRNFGKLIDRADLEPYGEASPYRMLPLFSTLLRISPDFRYDIVSRNLK
jgi:hypothetical protein